MKELPLIIYLTKEMQEIQTTSDKDTRLFAWGSAEFDQYDTGDENKFDSKKPIYIPFFSQNRIHIHKLACGAQHSLAVSTTGQVYSWGSPDEGALGRDKGEGAGKIPALVELEQPMDLICAGDSHSVCANSANGIVYTWGVYRNAISGKMSKPQMLPNRVGEMEFKKRRIQKILSGSNHTMVLADRKVFVWGDPDTCVLGRMPLKRRKFAQALKVGGLRYGKVVDIFTGGNHCFLINDRVSRKEGKTIRCVYAWGLNNWGQLGVGKEYDNTFKAVEISALRDKNVKKIAGGDHHTLFLLEDGSVYGCGRNDDYQLGPIDKQDFLEKHKDQDLEESELQKATPPAAYLPTKLNFDTPLRDIMAISNYSYGIQTDFKIRTWGLGFSFVLANGKEDEIKEPHTINPKFLKNTIGQICIGDNHVLFTPAEQDYVTPEVEEGIIKRIPKKRGRKKTKSKKKGKMNIERKTNKKGLDKSLKQNSDEELDLKRSSQDRQNVEEMVKPTKRGKENQ